MRKSSILMLTAVAALGSSFLVPADAFASHRGFAHAAQVSRSAHASTGGVHTASFGFRRPTGFQRPVSSGTVASGSFTQRRFGSANTAVGRPPSIASRFSMGNQTFGHTPQLNTLASNGHALTGPQAANDHAEKNTQTLSNSQVIADLKNQASDARAAGKGDLHRAQEASNGASTHCQIASNSDPLSLGRMTPLRCANVSLLREPRPAARSPT
jgi:hypothetical protein